MDPLARVVHLLVGLWDILGVGGMNRHEALFSEDTVKAGDGAGVAALPELDPENDQAGVGIPAAHIADQLEFLRGMLVWMGMRAAGTVTQGVPGAVIAPLPTVDILPIGLIFDSGLGDPKSLSILNQG